MIARSKTSFVTTVLTGGMLACACGPAAADTLSGKVLGGGQPIANSTVTLWAASEGAPQQLGQARTGADGSFTLNSTGGTGAVTLYLIAKGGQPQANAQAGLVMINVPTAGLDYHVPFGGRKASSYGPREQGSYAAEFYTVIKTAYISA